MQLVVTESPLRQTVWGEVFHKREENQEFSLRLKISQVITKYVHLIESMECLS